MAWEEWEGNNFLYSNPREVENGPRKGRYIIKWNEKVNERKIETERERKASNNFLRRID